MKHQLIFLLTFLPISAYGMYEKPEARWSSRKKDIIANLNISNAPTTQAIAEMTDAAQRKLWSKQASDMCRELYRWGYVQGGHRFSYTIERLELYTKWYIQAGHMLAAVEMADACILMHELYIEELKRNKKESEEEFQRFLEEKIRTYSLKLKIFKRKINKLKKRLCTEFCDAGKRFFIQKLVDRLYKEKIALMKYHYPKIANHEDPEEQKEITCMVLKRHKNWLFKRNPFTAIFHELLKKLLTLR